MMFNKKKNKDDFDVLDEYLEDDDYSDEYDEEYPEDSEEDRDNQDKNHKDKEACQDEEEISDFEADIEEFILDMEESEEGFTVEILPDKTAPISDELGFFTEDFEAIEVDEPTEYDIYKKNKESLGIVDPVDELVEYIDYDIDEKLKAEEKPIDLPEAGEEKIDIKAEIISWVKMLIMAAVLAFVITRFVIINANVPTGSMEDTISTGSRILGLRTSYIIGAPERGDIVVFKYQFSELEGKEETNYVKRIIGMPGERISIENGKVNVYKNGELVQNIKEDYLKEEWVWKNDGYTFDVPEGAYLVMGDNRNNSSDTRDWYDNYYKAGKCSYDDLFITENTIIGKVYMTYWPEFRFIDK